jgi:hypothetical protein
VSRQERRSFLLGAGSEAIAPQKLDRFPAGRFRSLQGGQRYMLDAFPIAELAGPRPVLLCRIALATRPISPAFSFPCRLSSLQ